MAGCRRDRWPSECWTTTSQDGRVSNERASSFWKALARSPTSSSHQHVSSERLQMAMMQRAEATTPACDTANGTPRMPTPMMCPPYRESVESVDRCEASAPPLGCMTTQALTICPTDTGGSHLRVLVFFVLLLKFFSSVAALCSASWGPPPQQGCPTPQRPRSSGADVHDEARARRTGQGSARHGPVH
eukprot:scaffold23845_cov112-Isochrysis_galbana.AAC.4